MTDPLNKQNVGKSFIPQTEDQSLFSQEETLRPEERMEEHFTQPISCADDKLFYGIEEDLLTEL